MERLANQRLTPISRVSFRLTDRNAFEHAVDLSLEWLARKAAGHAGGLAMLPSEARDRQTFDVSGDEHLHPCHAVRIDTAQGSTWAARIDEPGSDPGLGETWSTEVFVDRRPHELTRFGVQLSCRRGHGAGAFPPNRPNLVPELLRTLSADEDDEEISEQVLPIGASEVERLTALLHRPSRRLPVLALSLSEPAPPAPPERVAKRLCGAAHLVSLDAAASWELTRVMGKRMSVFGGAVRLYMPGMEEGDDDPFGHPLWLAGERRGNALIDMIAHRVFPLGFQDESGGERFWRVAQLREIAVKETAARTSRGRVETLRADVSARDLRIAELAELLEFSEGLEKEAADRERESRRRIEKLADENTRLRSRISALEQGNRAAGVASEPEDRRLEVYDDLEDWARETLGPNILIHSTAVKDCRKNGHRAMLERIEACLLTLRDHWLPAKLKGGMERQNMLAERLREQGIDDAVCFRTRDKAKRDPRYCVSHEGAKVVLYDHFKYGVARENDKQFRIYYAWLPDRKLVLIGKMPSHLPNDQS